MLTSKKLLRAEQNLFDVKNFFYENNFDVKTFFDVRKNCVTSKTIFSRQKTVLPSKGFFDVKTFVDVNFSGVKICFDVKSLFDVKKILNKGVH